MGGAGATLVSGLVGGNSWAAGVPSMEAGAPGDDAAGVLVDVPADGTVRSVAGLPGRGIVLNLWATWCVPCVAEMPALDALAAAVAGSGVVVLPLSSDRGGARAVERFYAERGVKTLTVALDPRGAAARALGATGDPDHGADRCGRAGAGAGRGGAEWDSARAIAMVKMLAG